MGMGGHQEADVEDRGHQEADDEEGGHQETGWICGPACSSVRHCCSSQASVGVSSRLTVLSQEGRIPAPAKGASWLPDRLQSHILTPASDAQHPPVMLRTPW